MNSDSAQKGFRTFILTLSISLIVFSVAYYALTNIPHEEATANKFQVKEKETAYNVKSESNEKSVFGNIRDSANSSAVLAAEDDLSGLDEDVIIDEDTTDDTATTTTTATATTTTTTSETTQSTTAVPNTGVFSITAGLFSAFILFVAALTFVTFNPRKLALDSFEKDITKLIL